MGKRFIPVAVPLAVLEKKAEAAEKKATESPEGRHAAIADALGDIYIRWPNPPKWMTGKS